MLSDNQNGFLFASYKEYLRMLSEQDAAFKTVLQHFTNSASPGSDCCGLAVRHESPRVSAKLDRQSSLVVLDCDRMSAKERLHLQFDLEGRLLGNWGNSKDPVKVISEHSARSEGFDTRVVIISYTSAFTHSHHSLNYAALDYLGCRYSLHPNFFLPHFSHRPSIELPSCREVLLLQRRAKQWPAEGRCVCTAQVCREPDNPDHYTGMLIFWI
jgi:hypothetical protein